MGSSFRYEVNGYAGLGSDFGEICVGHDFYDEIGLLVARIVSIFQDEVVCPLQVLDGAVHLLLA